VWSVIANETADRNKQEVRVLVLRYVLQHDNVWEIHESAILAVVQRYLTSTARTWPISLNCQTTLLMQLSYGRPVIIFFYAVSRLQFDNRFYTNIRYDTIRFARLY